ncbi:MAG TPA: DUF1259 domain-containing protein [Candidatus Angelobacter sp.]
MRNECTPFYGTLYCPQLSTDRHGKAAITGDFVLIGKEVTPVIQALRKNAIVVTALHSHMLGEPRLFFMHF